MPYNKLSEIQWNKTAHTFILLYLLVKCMHALSGSSEKLPPKCQATFHCHLQIWLEKGLLPSLLWLLAEFTSSGCRTCGSLLHQKQQGEKDPRVSLTTRRSLIIKHRVIAHQLCHILLVIQKLHILHTSKRKGIYKAANTRRQGNWRPP